MRQGRIIQILWGLGAAVSGWLISGWLPPDGVTLLLALLSGSVAMLLWQCRRVPVVSNRPQREQSEWLAGLGELSAGIAHEITNPIAYVSSNLQELQHDVSALTAFIHTLDQTSDQLDRHSLAYQTLLAAYREHDVARALQTAPERLRDCQQGLQRTGQIIRDMRRLSRGGPDKEHCQLETDIRSVLNIARALLPPGVQLREALQPLPAVYCNASQIAQVVMNLLVNAIQALEAQGGEILLSAGPDAAGIRLQVRDNGPGMDAATAARVFDLFFTTKKNGTGLGLPLCQRLIRAHGGRIELDTQPGQGTTFTVYLPAGDDLHAQ